MSDDLNGNRMLEPLKTPLMNNASTSQSLSIPTSNADNNNLQNKNYLDLNQSTYKLTDLKHFKFQDNEILNYINDDDLIPDSPNHILIIDTSPNNPSNLDPIGPPAKENIFPQNFNVDRIHLNLPTTLVKRPKFKFENLLQASLPKDKIKDLVELIHSCSTYIIFDSNSQFNKCSKKTYFLISKFIQYINMSYDTKNEKKIIFISSPTTPDSLPINMLNSPFGSPNTDQHIQKYNLSINIPSINSPPFRKKMFVQSIKKDPVHYSPLSLYKYFDYNIPSNIDSNDKILPNWLKPFSDKTKSNELLLKLENNFQLLEEFEMERLSTCLVNDNKKVTGNNTLIVKGTNNDKQSKSTNSTPIHSTHKIYSLTYLQEQFEQQRQNHNSPTKRKKLVNNTIDNAQNSSSIPLNNIRIHNDKQDSEDNSQFESVKKQSLPLKISTDHFSPFDYTTTTNNKNNNPSPYSANTNSSSEALVMHLDNYEVSQGIQSFSKNRYSNILPYEHSRVKLHYSPIERPKLNKSENASKGFFTHDDSNSIAEMTETNDSSSLTSFSSKLASTSTDKKRQNSLTLTPRKNSVSDKSLENKTDSTTNPIKTRPRLLHSSSSSYLRGKLQADKNKFNDYFNANYLNIPQINNDYKYVATQAPLVSTIDDFWNVVLSNKIKVIVSLNSETELEMKKWDIYWNNKNNSKHAINILATFDKVYGLNGCILRIFQVFKRDKTSFSIIFQIQYTEWLDSCTIDINELLQIFKLKDNLILHPIECVKDIMESQKNEPTDNIPMVNILKWSDLLSNSINFNLCLKSETPLLIHCSAGCGRTGVFIALDFLIKIFDKSTNQANKIDVWNMSDDLIFIIVNELRKQRLSMVQNLSQYIMCYESLLEFFALIKAHKISI